MSGFLNLCVKTQRVFIPGWQISDNILVSYEILHILKWKKWGKKDNFSFKLDMTKAYDRVEWDFFSRNDVQIGISCRLYDFNHGCVAFVTYTVGINGYSINSFVPSRKLWQGDPLSPYLFLLCVEGLSASLIDAQENNLIQGVCIGRRCMTINNFFCGW